MDNKKIFSVNLNKLMEKYNVSRYKLCDDLDIKYATLSGWLQGRKYPRMENIEKIAKYFSVPKSDLIEQLQQEITSNVNYIIPNSNIYQIPVFESVSAGFGTYASDDIVDYIPIVLHSQYEAENTISIKVKGDSMYPKIEDGDIVIVRKIDNIDNGDIAVVLLDGDEGLVKKIEYGNNFINLIPINPEYPKKTYKGADIERIRIVGKVIGIYKTL